MSNIERQLAPIERSSRAKLDRLPEFGTAVELLERHLILATPQGVKQIEIVAVEPFAEMLRADDKEDFASRPRARGEILILWRRGFPQLNIVVDPQKGSVVCIRTLKLDGKEISANSLVQLLGISKGRGGYPAFREAVDGRLDGRQTFSNDPQAEVRIEKLAETAGNVLSIREDTASAVAKNSLGVFVNADRV